MEHIGGTLRLKGEGEKKKRKKRKRETDVVDSSSKKSVNEDAHSSCKRTKDEGNADDKTSPTCDDRCEPRPAIGPSLKRYTKAEQTYMEARKKQVCEPLSFVPYRKANLIFLFS